MVTDNLTKLVKHYESLHDGDFKKIGLQPKLCPAGYWTIGYGHVVIKEGKPLTYKTPYSEVESLTLYDEEVASDLLARDLLKYQSSVIAVLNPKIIFQTHHIESCTSFTMNCGVGAFQSSTMAKLLNKGSFKEAAAQLLLWNKAMNPKTNQKEPLPGLTARRKSEQHYFLTGEIKFFN